MRHSRWAGGKKYLDFPFPPKNVSWPLLPGRRTLTTSSMSDSSLPLPLPMVVTGVALEFVLPAAAAAVQPVVVVPGVGGVAAVAFQSVVAAAAMEGVITVVLRQGVVVGIAAFRAVAVEPVADCRFHHFPHLDKSLNSTGGLA